MYKTFHLMILFIDGGSLQICCGNLIYGDECLLDNLCKSVV